LSYLAVGVNWALVCCLLRALQLRLASSLRIDLLAAALV